MHCKSWGEALFVAILLSKFTPAVTFLLRLLIAKPKVHNYTASRDISSTVFDTHLVKNFPQVSRRSKIITLPLHASRVAPLSTTKFRANSPYICNMLNDHCHRVSTHLQLIKLLLLLLLLLRTTVLWYVTPCSLVKIHQRFWRNLPSSVLRVAI